MINLYVTCHLQTDADALQQNKVTRILQHRQEKEKRQMEESLVTYRFQNQHLQTRREFDLNDPDRLRKLDQRDAQMMLPGLVGEDRDSQGRRQRQQEQLRDWLLQQQTEREEERQQQLMEGRCFLYF